MLAVIAFTAGCTKTDGEVLYCNPDDQSWGWLQRPGAMHIDLERRLVYGDDTSSSISPLVAGDFAGFEGEFPLLVFSNSVDQSEIPGSVVVNDTVFRLSPVEGSFGDLWLISAKPRGAGGEQESRHRSTVLYSTADGVLLIGFTAFIGEEMFPINYVPCGKRTLRYDDLRSFAEANG
jgi:hypothetical protein